MLRLLPSLTQLMHNNSILTSLPINQLANPEVIEAQSIVEFPQVAEIKENPVIEAAAFLSDPAYKNLVEDGSTGIPKANKKLLDKQDDKQNDGLVYPNLKDDERFKTFIKKHKLSYLQDKSDAEILIAIFPNYISQDHRVRNEFIELFYRDDTCYDATPNFIIAKHYPKHLEFMTDYFSMNDKNKEGETVLHYSVRNNFGKAVDLLLLYGANVNILWVSPDKVSYTIFDIAIQTDNPAMFDRIVKNLLWKYKSALDVFITLSENILFTAARENKFAMLQHIFKTYPEASAFLLKRKNAQDYSPLTHPIYSKFIKTALATIEWESSYKSTFFTKKEHKQKTDTADSILRTPKNGY